MVDDSNLFDKLIFFLQDYFKNLGRPKRLSIVLTGVVAVLVVIISLLIYNFAVPNLRTYENKTYGFQVKYPAGWRVVEDQPGVAVGFISPQESALDVFMENISVVVQPVGDTIPSTLTTYTETAIRQIQAVFKDGIRVTESTPTLLSNTAGYKFVYEGTEKQNTSMNLKLMHVWCLKNGFGYQVTYSGLVNTFDQNKKLVDTVIDSFKIR